MKAMNGHVLAHTGSAVDDELLPTGGKVGVGACECGQVSDVEASTGARRAWHRAHLAEVRAQAMDQ